MKKNIIISLLLSFLLFTGCGQSLDASADTSSQKSNVVLSSTPAPKWQLKDIDNKSYQFPESEKGKTTVLFFWASWCPYCKSLMPHIQSALYEYQAELDLQIFALSIFDDGDPLEFISESGFDFEVFANADEVAKLHQIQGTPGLIIIDGEGNIRFDLRDIKTDHLKASGNKHWQKARKKSPYWAAEFRKALELLTQE